MNTSADSLRRAVETTDYGAAPLFVPRRKPQRPKPDYRPLPLSESEFYSGHSKVYLIRCGNFVKIGTSVDLPNRMRCLQGYNPMPLKLIAVILGGHSLERAIHNRFADLRHSDEWFKWGHRISAWVQGGCSMRYIKGKPAGKAKTLVGLEGIEPSTFPMSRERSPAEL